MEKKLRYHVKSLIVAGLVVAVTAGVAVFDLQSTLFKTSVLDLPTHLPFDGTVYPVQKVPDWVNLSNDKRYAEYNSLTDDELIDIMEYDAAVLATGTDDLDWGNDAHNAIRNAKVTYSTPYMGSYKLNGLEADGSHLAVDIKVPSGTPVYAIANGVLTKVSNSNSGFGHHIVIRHDGVPTLGLTGETQVLHSSYSHLGETLVQVGAVVNKGDMIAFSGETGTASTPHVHFQIDNDDAPWHPYWPFTFAEAADAGLNFFSAVNAGLGQEEAYRTTVHPMLYVQAFIDGDFEITDLVGVSNSEENLADVASDDGNEVIDEMEFEEEIIIEDVPEDVVPDEVEVVEDVAEIEEVVGEEVVEETPEMTVNQVFTDIPEGSEYYEATLYLSLRDVIAGYPDGSFGPGNTVNRVEVLKFIIEGVNIGLATGELPFVDTENSAWYAEYLYTGYEEEIVNGDPNGAYRPADTVNKAEFYKILFLGLGVDVPPTVEEAPFADVSAEDWHAPYFALAKEYGIVTSDEDGNVNPAVGMSRGDVSVAMWKLMLMLEG
jgi:murein DD-endopeptidase MepM/ murein hydrolase activator NlpD